LFGAHLPSDASSPAQLHFGSDHVSGTASGKNAQTRPFKFSYASMWTVNLKPRNDGEGALVELRFDQSKVREAMATDTADNVLQLAVPASQAEALRQRCLPHLPACVKRTDTVPPLAPAASGLVRARKPSPLTSARPPASQSVNATAAAQHVSAGHDGLVASSDPGAAPEGATEAEKRSAFPSFDQVVRLKNSKEACEASGTRKSGVSRPGTAEHVPSSKAVASKAAAPKPSSKQPAPGAKKPKEGVMQSSARGSARQDVARVNAHTNAGPAAALIHSKVMGDDDTSAACGEGGDGNSSADEECGAMHQDASKNQSLRAPGATVGGGTRSSMRSAAAAARGAIQRAALADCIASDEVASTGRDAPEETLAPGSDEASAGDDSDGIEEAASDEEAGDGIGRHKANYAVVTQVSASEESSGEDEAPPQISAARSVPPPEELTSGAAGRPNGRSQRIAAPRNAVEDEHSSSESFEDEAPLRQRVSKIAKPKMPSKNAPAVGNAKSKLKPIAAAAVSADVAKSRRSAWNRFLKSKKASIEREQPGVYFPEVQKLVSAMWARMTQAEKDAWSEPSAPTVVGADRRSAEGSAQLEPSMRPRLPAPAISVAAADSDDESETGSLSQDAGLAFNESAACAYGGQEPMRARQPLASDGGRAVRAASFPSHNSASDADQKEDSDGIERGRAVLPWPASSALGHAATKHIPQKHRRGAAAKGADKVEQLLGRLSQASRTWRRSHIVTLSARGKKEIDQHAAGTKRKFAAVHNEAPVSADHLHQKCQRLTAAWESLKAAHESVRTARLRTSQASMRMLRQLQASCDGMKDRVAQRLQDLTVAVTEEQKKARSKRARESKKLQEGGNALQNLMMDLGSVMNLASFDESE
jgi:hypothetical protein